MLCVAKRVAVPTNSYRRGDFRALRTAAPHSRIPRVQDQYIRPEQRNLSIVWKRQENLANVLSGCGALAQSKYLERHNAAFKVLFFYMCRALNLVETVPPWFSKTEPKLTYESKDAQAFWDVPVYADHTFVSANRVDARFVKHVTKQVILAEISCPWLENREKKEAEKTKKYGPLCFELARGYPGCKIIQLNVIIDVLGGWSKDVEAQMRKIFGVRTKDVLKRMQKAVISGSLNIARMFKVRVI